MPAAFTILSYFDLHSYFFSKETFKNVNPYYIFEEKLVISSKKQISITLAAWSFKNKTKHVRYIYICKQCHTSHRNIEKYLFCSGISFKSKTFLFFSKKTAEFDSAVSAHLENAYSVLW